MRLCNRKCVSHHMGIRLRKKSKKKENSKWFHKEKKKFYYILHVFIAVYHKKTNKAFYSYFYILNNKIKWQRYIYIHKCVETHIKNFVVWNYKQMTYDGIMVHLAVKKRTFFKSKRKSFIQAKRGISISVSNTI